MNAYRRRAAAIGPRGGFVVRSATPQQCTFSESSWDECGLIAKLGERMHRVSVGASGSGNATAVQKTWGTPGLLVARLNMYLIAGSTSHTVGGLLSEPRETYLWMLKWITDHVPQNIPPEYAGGD